MKAGHDGQLLHGQLLGGLLVTMATTALDLSAAAEVLWPGEPGTERMRFSARVCVCVCRLIDAAWGLWRIWEEQEFVCRELCLT